MNDLFNELETCSLALLEALRHKRPTYLEHLARRTRLLGELSMVKGLADGAELRVKLRRIRTLGVLAAQQAHLWGEAANRDLASVAQDRALLQGLRAQVRPNYKMLNLKA